MPIPITGSFGHRHLYRFLVAIFIDSFFITIYGRGWDLVVSAVFKTVGCNLLQRQVRFLLLPNLKYPAFIFQFFRDCMGAGILPPLFTKISADFL